MVATASIASDFATGAGLLAAMIAVVGFLAHARPALLGDPEEEVHQAMVRGGILGFGAGACVIVLSAMVG